MPPIGDELARQVIKELPQDFTAEAYGIPIRKKGDLFLIQGAGKPVNEKTAIALLMAKGIYSAQRLHITGGDPPNLTPRRPRQPRPATEPVELPEIAYPKELRAISIAGAYAYALLKFNDRKPAELRTWKTSWRGIVLLHVCQSKEWDDSYQDWGITLEQCPKSCLLGIAQMSDCKIRTDGMWGHRMSNPLLFPEPIRGIPGDRNYWRAKKPAQVEGFNRAWAIAQEMGWTPK